MLTFELAYARMIKKILSEGTIKETRNGNTQSLFGMSLEVPDVSHVFPIIQGRTMYPKGVLGELAAMLRRPKHISDFEKWGCNYWKDWAQPDGSINIDYGNAWFDFEGINQIEQLKHNLENNPNDRRMIISGWRPHKLQELDLPCCHYNYQFYVVNKTISMIWTQRSVDMMIGLPSDIIFAAAWLIAIANEFGFKPGKIKFDLGDCHVYEEHFEGAEEYISRVLDSGWAPHRYPTYRWTAPTGKDFCEFTPKDILLSIFDNAGPIKLELKA